MKIMNLNIEKIKRDAEIPVISGQWDYNDREVLINDEGEWRPATPSEIIATLFQMEKAIDKFAVLHCQEFLSKFK